MSFRDQFPDFDPAALPAIPANWEDASWRNDACPCWKAGALLIYVDYDRAELRENEGGARFIVDDADSAHIHLETDDWLGVLALVPATDRKAALAAEYVERVGYDPFEDSPDISPDEVEQTLVELRAIMAAENKAE